MMYMLQHPSSQWHFSWPDLYCFKMGGSQDTPSIYKQEIWGAQFVGLVYVKTFELWFCMSSLEMYDLVSDDFYECSMILK